jgi:Proteolysis_6 C-terminal
VYHLINSCSRVGKCQNHAVACGAGIGVFLLVKVRTILLENSFFMVTLFVSRNDLY